ncbi:MAG TPA: universal stress protein [Thermoanaerobaculia bacterium]|nr:universal stress protein [Thermoanaerobaculia bacterium]
MATAGYSVLVPVDFSSASRKALREAGKLAERMGASLTLLHVRPFSDVRAAIAEGREDLLKGPSAALAAAMKSHYAQRLAALAARSGAAETRLVSGRASREIVRAAKGFDLVVMGRTGRGGISGLLGGTTHKVLAACEVPVAVVPS